MQDYRECAKTRKKNALINVLVTDLKFPLQQKKKLH